MTNESIWIVSKITHGEDIAVLQTFYSVREEAQKHWEALVSECDHLLKKVVSKDEFSLSGFDASKGEFVVVALRAYRIADKYEPKEG